MEKSLSDRIAKRESYKKIQDKSQRKVIFFALQSEIQGALDKGWSIKVIWETLFEEGKISFTYKTFWSYVSKYILLEKSSPLVSEKKVNLHKSKSKNNTSHEIPTFTFNPTPNPEELL